MCIPPAKRLGVGRPRSDRRATAARLLRYPPVGVQEMRHAGCAARSAAHCASSHRVVCAVRRLTPDREVGAAKEDSCSAPYPFPPPSARMPAHSRHMSVIDSHFMASWSVWVSRKKIA